ncbi:hypothetical protein AB0E63_06280 [Kribbella sp. NPDC026596]|uniref:hypothetical protein n=1 Tax=Kribbella sp. NPDC026596 TaxID=3155122 RepID=UPI00340A42C9
MNPYSDGLQHGYADAHKAIREILALDVSDAEKLRLIGHRVADPKWTDTGSGPGWPPGGVVELPDSPDDEGGETL